MFFRRRSDLPMNEDTLGRFLPWLIAFMVFLAALALAGMLVLGDAVARWDTGLNATVTVQVPPGTGAKDDEQRLGQVLAVLARQEGVERYETLSKENLLSLLKPWIGEAGQAADLPIPVLIDVTVDRDADLDIGRLGQELAALVPGVSVDDHRVWLSQLVRLVTVIQILAWAVLGLIALATVGTVVFTTRTGLAVHRDAIEVLHLIGAQDAYIARQFAARALGLGLRGGFLGLLMAVPTLVGIGYLASQTGSAMVPAPEFGLLKAIGFLALPVAVALLAMTTARSTVMRNLKKMT
ncbi:MAG TPA: cell division protein [Rhodospirillaceae bacterium]|nr:cell division protein [Rhodospirillaceae bacterium]|tara:strand:+ start:64 stop:948 length:885 start_codon:yes stop_codon:yes gene_type:complete